MYGDSVILAATMVTGHCGKSMVFEGFGSLNYGDLEMLAGTMLIGELDLGDLRSECNPD